MIWVSSSGKDKMAIMWMHSHYQAMIPYTGIPPVEPPEPEQSLPQFAPYIDGTYIAQVVDLGQGNVPYIDDYYSAKVKDPVYPEDEHPYVDSIYIAKEVIVDGEVIYDAGLVVMSTRYETE